MSDELVLIDDTVVVDCAPADALACLDGPQAIATWFGAQRSGERTVLRSPLGELELHREHERWVPSDGVFTADGSIGPVRFHAYLTLRAVIRTDARRHLHEGTELWAHVELWPATLASKAGVIIRSAIHRGLEHLRLELDADPDSTR